MPSVARILQITPTADYLASNYIAKRQLFGGTINPQQPIVIFSVYYILKRIYDYSGIVSAVNAAGTITIDDVGDVGDRIQIVIDDPDYGIISLGSYTVLIGDTTTTILAGNIAALCATNGYGYGASSDTNIITITARPGLGATMNTGNKLQVVITPYQFSPIDISNLLSWYKSDTGVTGTTQVTAWADQSGNGNNLSFQSSLFAELQTNVINGYPVIKKPTATNAWLQTSANVPDNVSSGMTIFLVGSQNTEGSNGIFLSVGASLDIGIFRTASSNFISEKMRSAASVATATTINDGTFYSVRTFYNGTNQSITINDGTPDVNAVAAGSYTPAPLNLFSLSTGAAFGNKQIAEVIIYNRNLTAPEIAQVETYLNDKYALY